MLVHWNYINKDLFGNISSKKEKLYTVTAKKDNEMTRDILERKQILALLPNKSKKDPYFNLNIQEGYTPRSKNYGKIRMEMINKYPEFEGNCTTIKSRVYDYGEYIYIKVPYLDIKTNSLVKEFPDVFYNDCLVYKEKFNLELLNMIVEYKPIEGFSRAFNDYYPKLKKFLAEVKLKYPSLAMEARYSSIELRRIFDEIEYKGMKAKLWTLSEGKVYFISRQLLYTKKFYWDGEYLSAQLKDGSEIFIKPDKDTIVEIIDEQTINSYTEIVS